MAKSLTLFDFAPGSVVDDRFEILGPHRQGGMSATFAVTDRMDGAKRELQVFPGALFETPKEGAKFAESLERWRAVQHDNVLHVIDVQAKEDGATLLLSEFPPERVLREIMKDKEPLAAEEVRRLGLSLSEGLSACHQAGLVHGDIKPFTVHLRVDDERQPVLVDGGITRGLWSAKHLGDKTALIGTPVYAPVEQFGGDPPSEVSDIYNLSTVLYELVSGVVPWPGSNFLEIFQAKLEKVVPPMRRRAPGVEVPLELEAAIAKGLCADPRDRWQSAAELAEALSAASLE